MKYQGGYQIIDLSGGGIYDKAKSAFETNKPVLVYDGGIASFGNVVKDSTYYVVNYIIDDKLYQAAIAGDDTVTKTNIDLGDSSSDIEALETAVNGLTNEAGTGTVDKLEDDVAILKNTGVDSTFVAVADESSTLPVSYTCPSDGYIRHYNNTLPSAGNVQTNLATKNGTNSGCVIGELNANSAIGGKCTYVRKGQKIYVLGGATALASGSFNVRFYPFETE